MNLIRHDLSTAFETGLKSPLSMALRSPLQFIVRLHTASPLLKGRLKTKLDYWHTIGNNNFVIDTVKFGYRIPFISTACRALFHNNKSALENTSFAESGISELVGNRSVVEVHFVPHVVDCYEKSWGDCLESSETFCIFN